MSFELDTQDLEQGFNAQDIALIRKQFLRAATLCQRFMPIDDVQIKFWLDKVSPAWSIMACAPDAHHMTMFMSPDHFYLRTNKNNGRVRFSAVVLHELHHNKRDRSVGVGYGRNLGRSIISEGLALKFQRETGHTDFPEERFIRGESLNELAERAKPLLGRFIPFRGPIDPDVDSINRYALGLAVVEGWSRYSGITAAEAHAVPAEEVLEPWLASKFPISSQPLKL